MIGPRFGEFGDAAQTVTIDPSWPAWKKYVMWVVANRAAWNAAGGDLHGITGPAWAWPGTTRKATIPAYSGSAHYTEPANPVLGVNQILKPDQYLLSNDKRYMLLVQQDGNLVVYSTRQVTNLGLNAGAAVWASGSRGRPAYLIMQGDGNLVLYGQGIFGSGVIWAMNRVGGAMRSGAIARLQDDGNLVVGVPAPKSSAWSAVSWNIGAHNAPPAAPPVPAQVIDVMEGAPEQTAVDFANSLPEAWKNAENRDGLRFIVELTRNIRSQSRAMHLYGCIQEDIARGGGEGPTVSPEAWLSAFYGHSGGGGLRTDNAGWFADVARQAQLGLKAPQYLVTLDTDDMYGAAAVSAYAASHSNLFKPQIPWYEELQGPNHAINSALNVIKYVGAGLAVVAAVVATAGAAGIIGGGVTTAAGAAGAAGGLAARAAGAESGALGPKVGGAAPILQTDVSMIPQSQGGTAPDVVQVPSAPSALPIILGGIGGFFLGGPLGAVAGGALGAALRKKAANG